MNQTFDPVIAQSMYRKLITPLDALSYKGERAYWYTRRVRVGPRTVQELEAVLYGEVDPHAVTALVRLKKAIKAGYHVEAMALPLVFPDIRARINELHSLVSETRPALADTPNKLKKFNRSAIVKVHRYLSTLNEFGEEDLPTDVPWSKYRWTGEQGDPISVDIAVSEDYLIASLEG